ncbi:DUF2625 domain-containing protein [Paenibacillus sp. MER TA 81-3]|uniref:DUF2625 family protein n=1 Tax=Paenibacillus sp. MER TA 81-3 TaxID=2939573 RepID=UPI002040E63F|nr:DUF2625 family protein [Paenibacillus sp. MER TA 81-3]MCM3337488.1 DUF2625 domain-containing protein [Paenibacillus sp. MER TA 81-3]
MNASDNNEQTWAEIVSLFEQGSNDIVIMPVCPERAEETLQRLQVSERSYLGSIACHSGGVMVDRGWIKLLGSGSELVYGDLLSWNGLGEDTRIAPLRGACVIAYDMAGGFFALNGGRFGEEEHSVYYFAPDTLEWENTELAYSEFLAWLANGDLELYYRTFRWSNWQEDAASMDANQVISYFPPLWSEEGSAETSSRKAVHIEEIWNSCVYEQKD